MFRIFVYELLTLNKYTMKFRDFDQFNFEELRAFSEENNIVLFNRDMKELNIDNFDIINSQLNEAKRLLNNVQYSNRLLNKLMTMKYYYQVTFMTIFFRKKWKKLLDMIYVHETLSNVYYTKGEMLYKIGSYNSLVLNTQYNNMMKEKLNSLI